MARLIEEFELQGCAVYQATGSRAPWDFVVHPIVPGERLRLVWSSQPIETDRPLAILLRREGISIAPRAQLARACGFHPLLATHQPDLPERSLWTIEPA